MRGNTKGTMILEGAFSAAICSIVIAWVYIIVVKGLLSDVYIPRITKASFGLKIWQNAFLWFAYFVGGILNIYLIVNIIKILKDIVGLNRLGYFSILFSDSSQYCVILLAFSLLYIGRIITRKRGIFYGKLHFSGFFLLGFTLFAFKFLNSLFLPSNISSLDSILIYIYNTVSILIDYSFVCAKGTFVLATIGEGILFLTPANPRSLLAVSDKLPSDLRVITGYKGIESKLHEMMSSDKTVSKLRCVTKSCNILNTIEFDIYYQFFGYEDRMKQIGKADMPCLQFIIAPEEKFLEDLNKSYERIKSRAFNFSSKKEKIIRYENSKLILNNLINDKKITVKRLYFGELRFISIEYENHNRNLMLIVRDGGLTDRVGIYTEEPYIVDIFVNIFDIAWEKR